MTGTALGGSFGIPSRSRRSDAIGSRESGLSNLSARAVGPESRSDRYGPNLDDEPVRAVQYPERSALPIRRVPYTTSADHPYTDTTAGCWWSGPELWIAARAVRDEVQFPPGVLTFPEVPPAAEAIAAVFGLRDVQGWTRVLVTGAGGRPLTMSRGAAHTSAQLAGQVVATLVAVSGASATPEQVFRESTNGIVQEELAERLDLVRDWSLDVDEIPSRVVRILGIRGVGDEALVA